MVKHMSRLEEEAMAYLCKDIFKEKRAQSAYIRVKIDFSRNKYPQNGPIAREISYS